ncbi:hypothetical protein CPB83DRAFT_909233 [Crepidotus variabilis]|uniref:Uncharacterized protein n=1 Tax=Crepidotus variabilis TaxID=179855 RepID=A0A9P6JLN1_9AGAR|nr:hypothetical protein CPB83DRAFT_909233 [Crepidotus variabilis]
MAATVARPRLSARRGSNAAPDPFNAHANVNLNPNRSSSSVLTIVRVPSSTPASTPTAHEPPSSPALSRRGQLHHRRVGSGNSTSSEHGQAAPPPGRLSFAFSSFGGSNPRPSSPTTAGPSSPTSSPRLRPSSPHQSASSFSSKPRLTPDQLVDLARQATRAHAQGHTPATSPGIGAHHSPVQKTQPLPAAEAATFTPLPFDIYLPFIDRPSEVASLITSPPDAKLFTLLAQTFRGRGTPSVDSPNPMESDKLVDLPRDPIHWTYNQLIYHLTRIDRDIVPDFIWAIAARKCILSHSELIWERIKGALGVPPELDVDYDFLEDDEESPDIGGHAQLEASGEDWEQAIMDSPVYSRVKQSPERSTSVGIEDKLGGLQGSISVNTIAPTPQNTLDDLNMGGLVMSPMVDGYQDEDEAFVSIEPLISPPLNAFNSASSSNPPPLSLPGAHSVDGLGDIAEGAEEEEEEEDNDVTKNAPKEEANEAEDPDLILPSQIHGLRIATGPIHATSPSMGASHSSATTPAVDASSPPTEMRGLPSRTHSRTSSFSSIGPFQRSESTGNLSNSWTAAANASYAASVFGGSEAGDSSSGLDYMSDGDRPAGNPLFVSNFARLNHVPSIRANNPSTRPPHYVPHARYISTAPFHGPSLANRPGKVRAYSHGNSTHGLHRPGNAKRQSWGAVDAEEVGQAKNQTDGRASIET